MKDENTEIECDVCVVGAGAAGIIFVLEYAKANPLKKVVLVEYGADVRAGENELDKTIEIKNTLNHHLPFECTNKGLGGSTTTWGGRCVMYDEVDFIDRPIVKGGCTWELSLFKEVNQYLKPTAKYFECGESKFNTADIASLKDQTIAEGFINGDVTDSVIERWSMPTRFGKRYKAELDALKNVVILEGYEARKLSLDKSNNKITEIHLAKIAGQGIEIIKAKHFVLSAGAQETTRILLKNATIFDALGEVPSALGKYYQGHLSGKRASVKFYGDPKKTNFGFLKDDEGIYLRRRFQFSTDFLVKNNLKYNVIYLRENPPSRHFNVKSKLKSIIKVMVFQQKKKKKIL